MRGGANVSPVRRTVVDHPVLLDRRQVDLQETREHVLRPRRVVRRQRPDRALERGVHVLRPLGLAQVLDEERALLRIRHLRVAPVAPGRAVEELGRGEAALLELARGDRAVRIGVSQQFHRAAPEPHPAAARPQAVAPQIVDEIRRLLHLVVAVRRRDQVVVLREGVDGVVVVGDAQVLQHDGAHLVAGAQVEDRQQPVRRHLGETQRLLERRVALLERLPVAIGARGVRHHDEVSRADELAELHLAGWRRDRVPARLRPPRRPTWDRAASPTRRVRCASRLRGARDRSRPGPAPRRRRPRIRHVPAGRPRSGRAPAPCRPSPAHVRRTGSRRAARRRTSRPRPRAAGRTGAASCSRASCRTPSTRRRAPTRRRPRLAKPAVGPVTDSTRTETCDGPTRPIHAPTAPADAVSAISSSAGGVTVSETDASVARARAAGRVPWSRGRSVREGPQSSVELHGDARGGGGPDERNRQSTRDGPARPSQSTVSIQPPATGRSTPVT